MNDSIPSLGQFIEPAPVSFSLNAPGWNVVAVTLILSLLTTGIGIIIHYRKNRYRRKALKQINKEQQRLATEKKYIELLYVTNSIIKKITIRQHGRQQVASLQSKEWLDFLNNQCNKVIFNTTDKNLLTHLYLVDNNQPDEKETMDFVSKAKQWIKQHRHAPIHRQ